MVDFNHGCVVAITGEVDRPFLDCLGAMLAARGFPKPPQATDPRAENDKVVAVLDALPRGPAPIPFLKACFRQESGLRHFNVPRAGDEDTFIVLGVDTNASEKFVITSRGYGPAGRRVRQLAPQHRRRPRMPNETPAELVVQILELTERYPTYSYVRIAQQLRLVGVGVTPSAVRAVWQRQGLTLRYQRLLWLEQKTAAAGGVLSESLMRLLRRHRGKVTDPEAHVGAPRSGFLLCQDTYFVGTIKGVGKIYMQSVVDAHCSLGFAKLYLSKVPMTAVDVLHERVLPFYEEHGVTIEHALSDNGWEYCGRPLRHPDELYLAINQIEHRRTDIGSPQTNGFCERFHRTAKEEFFSVAFRKTFYERLAQLQADLDRYMAFYNQERAHQGYRTRGRTPYQTFLDGVAAMNASEKEDADAA